MPDFTGLSGPWKATGRADECPKCGGKSTRDTWVMDGYSKRFVCPRCYDPPELEWYPVILEVPPVNED
jgi:ribosomal protein S27AE